jgi:signal transduction histidine kinase
VEEDCLPERSPAPEAAPGFAGLVRELDGHVPGPILCVDPLGRIRAAALPRSCGGGSLRLEGELLRNALAADSEPAATWIDELRRTGHVRVRLGAGGSGALAVDTEAYVILVEAGEQRGEITPDPDMLPDILDASPTPLLALDSARFVVLANASARELLGTRNGALTGRAMASLFVRRGEARRFDVALVQGDSAPLIAELHCDGVPPRRLELTPRPLYRGQEQVQGWVVWLHDVRRTLREPSGLEDLEQCLETVAHDLRNPLFSVQGFASLLDREFGSCLEERGRGYLDQLRASVERMQWLLEDLLTAARLRSPVSSLTRVATLPLLQQVLADLKPQLEAGGIRLFLPAKPPPLYTEPTRFYQVVLNLVSNAVQHMGPVTSPEIRITLGKESGGVSLCVRDNGTGISAGERERIFDAYFRGGNGTDRGNGLGLAIVKRIMEAHGGRVEVEAARGGGAVFRAFFPDPT